MDETQPSSSPASSKSSGSKMMIIMGVVVALLLLGVGGYYMMNKNSMKQTNQSETMAPKASPTSSGMFSSIQEALSKSLSLKCDFTDDATKAKTTAYIKAGAIRGDVVGGASENSSFIMKDKKMYFWTGKKGMMMAFDLEELKKNMPSVSPAKTQTMQPGGNASSMIEALEKFKESCKSSAVDDKVFTPPSDVTFQDLSKMMPSGMMMPKVSGVPAVPSGMSQEKIQEMQKEMMDKYKVSPTGQ